MLAWKHYRTNIKKIVLTSWLYALMSDEIAGSGSCKGGHRTGGFHQ